MFPVRQALQGAVEGDTGLTRQPAGSAGACSGTRFHSSGTELHVRQCQRRQYPCGHVGGMGQHPQGEPYFHGTGRSGGIREFHAQHGGTERID